MKKLEIEIPDEIYADFVLVHTREGATEEETELRVKKSFMMSGLRGAQAKAQSHFKAELHKKLATGKTAGCKALRDKLTALDNCSKGAVKFTGQNALEATVKEQREAKMLKIKEDRIKKTH